MDSCCRAQWFEAPALQGPRDQRLFDAPRRAYSSTALARQEEPEPEQEFGEPAPPQRRVYLHATQAPFHLQRRRCSHHRFISTVAVAAIATAVISIAIACAAGAVGGAAAATVFAFAVSCQKALANSKLKISGGRRAVLNCDFRQHVGQGLAVFG